MNAEACRQLHSEIRALTAAVRHLAAKVRSYCRTESSLGLDDKLQRIEAIVCEEYGVSPSALRWHCREDHLVEPRHVAFHLARELLHLSTPILGRWLKRDHGTVQYAIIQVHNRREVDGRFSSRLARLTTITRLALQEPDTASSL